MEEEVHGLARRASVESMVPDQSLHLCSVSVVVRFKSCHDNFIHFMVLHVINVYVDALLTDEQSERSFISRVHIPIRQKH